MAARHSKTCVLASWPTKHFWNCSETKKYVDSCQTETAFALTATRKIIDQGLIGIDFLVSLTKKTIVFLMATGTKSLPIIITQ
jgi:hypothetical protein